MPSAFPGMDPFIESQCWRDFHASVIGEIRSSLQPQLRPHYVAFVEAKIPYLVIRRRSNDETIAVIEVLSPTNKSPRDGRPEYLAKRNALLRSRTHLVELDLLRSGERLPTIEPHPAGDYFAFVSRAELRPEAEVYAWTLEQPLPTIPIPLADDDPDVQLNLQSVFDNTYDRAGYDYALKYDRTVEPSLNERQIAWVQRILPASP